MRIDVDPTRMPTLLAYLEERSDCIWSATGVGELDVTIIGSYADGGAAELQRRLDSWDAAGTSPPRVRQLGRARTALRARALSPLRTRRR